MNFSIIKRTIGWLLLFETVFLLVPLVTAVIYWEEAFFSFLVTMAICGACGGLLLVGKPKNTSIFAKEGFVIVALCWIVMSLFGALPFYFSGAIPSYIDALFETVSGFTTTGASILSGDRIEGMAKSLLMWRSFTHWVGGMGVLVLIMAFLPLGGSRNLYLMQAESPGPTVNKLVPKVRRTALILYFIYTAFTLVQFVMLVCGKMPVFEALTTAFATAGTGGFSVKSNSMAGYSPYIQIVTTVFMLLFSVNFTSYYLISRGKIKDALNMEARMFFLIVVAAISLVTINVYFTYSPADGSSYGLWETIRHAAFSVASIISTTGFATADFNLWPTLSKGILVVLMFIGACAGSTGGGMKVSRHIILAKGGMHEIKRLINPRQVKMVTVDGRAVDYETVRSVNAYMVAYFLLFTVSFLLIAVDGMGIETSFTAVAATFNNVGPGLGAVGPSGNFADFSVFSKFVFIFDMLAGRLEIFPMLVLFSPVTWRK
ncbi:MAG: TrkH family potassium uptake protein [Clostridia bacterium]|nr:TrkH family potassium uptake protein [Clostridia bacterium]